MICSETSPRVSFSHDLRQAEEEDLSMELNGTRRDTMHLESSSCSDFEFNICSFEQQSSSADELFANGMLLPARLQGKHQVQKCEVSPPISLPPRPKLSTVEVSKKESLSQVSPLNSDVGEQKPQSKSFWSFKRSSSLNSDAKKSLICSLPLLSRSNSTGSVPNPKRSSSIKVSNKQKFLSYQFPQKPPSKKKHGNDSYGNGVRISPVLNVPPPYISKGTVSLLGLGSFLLNGKDKKNRK